MSKEWDYSKLSKLAKENGGPEHLVDMLISSGKKGMIPWIAIAFGFGIGVTLAAQKVYRYFKDKKKSNKELEMAKQELIQGIKEYDKSQLTSEEEPDANGTLNTDE